MKIVPNEKIRRRHIEGLVDQINYHKERLEQLHQEGGLFAIEGPSPRMTEAGRGIYDRIIELADTVHEIKRSLRPPVEGDSAEPRGAAHYLLTELRKEVRLARRGIGRRRKQRNAYGGHGMKIIVTYKKEDITHIRLMGIRPSRKGWRKGIVNYVSHVLGGTLLHVDAIM